MQTKFGKTILTILFCGAVLFGVASNARAQLQTVFDYSKSWKFNTNGLDLGTAWQAPGYDDSSWPAGNGVLATAGEALLQGATIGTVLQMSNGPVPPGRFLTNIYFRTTFNLTSVSNGTVLIASNLLDDGAVIYLNGVEVARPGMPAGAVNSTTFASRGDEVTAHLVDVVTITNGFNSGNNTLAVEVHQNSGTSSDVVMGMKLMQINPQKPSIIQQPQSQSAQPGVNVSFSVAAAGTAPLFYQWRSNNVNIAGATGTTYTKGNVQTSADYTVVITNVWGAVTSSVATLTVGCVTAPAFTVQPLDRTLAVGATLSLSASAGGTLPISYQWYRNGVLIPGATATTYTKANVQAADSGLYYAMASNCITGASGRIASSNSVVSIAPPGYLLVGYNQDWRYNQNGVDLGTAWRQSDYNDSAWPLGKPNFGVETSAAPPITTPWTLNDGSGVFKRTYYVRTKFVLTNDVDAVSLISSNIFDDGIVVFLNGKEIYRMNMGSGTISYDTLAPGTTTENVYWMTNFPRANLVKGTNTIAVEVHQASLDSSDIVFGMAVYVNYPSPALLVITDDLENQTIEEAKATTLNLGLSGEPAFFQWYKESAALTNTANPLVIYPTLPGDAGNYFVVVTNAINAVTSSVVTLTVLADTNAPFLVDADGQSATNVMVSYSELVLPSIATNTANYKITNTVNGGTISITRAVLVDGTNVNLTTANRGTGTNFILVVNNVKDISTAQNTIIPNSRIPISTTFRAALPIAATYNYYQPQYQFFDPSPDQGTTWKETSFTIPAYWQGGNGGFVGSDTIYEVPYSVGVNLGQSELITSYYRTLFDTQVSPGGAQLRLSYFVDDGAIFYLNGTEVHRFNMRAGSFDYLTRPLSVIGSGTMSDPVVLPEGIFRQGQNLLAIELHQAEQLDHDAALAAQLDIKARSLIMGSVVITGGPADQTVMEGQSATFTVMQAGGATFQWKRNGTNIPGETNYIFRIPTVTQAYHTNLFSVAVGNTNGTVTSTNATLFVLPDTVGPQLVGAVLNTAGGNITVSFSEPLSAASAQTLANYRVTNSLGQIRSITSATLVNQTNVVLASPGIPLARYTIVVSNVRDASTGSNVIRTNSAVVAGYDVSIVSMGGTWKYDDTNTDLGTAWRTNGYDDSAWQSGPALLGAKRGDVPANMPEPLRTTITLSNNTADLPAVYFRTAFNAFKAPSAELTYSTLVDDGAVIYLNGVEVRRIGMPAGTINYTTLASRTAGDVPALEGPFTDIVTNLVDGVNVIQVEVHQAALDSSDIYWAGEFALSIKPVVLPPPPTNVCSAIAWTYPQLKIASLTTNSVRLSWLENPITNAAPCNQRAVLTVQYATALTNGVTSANWVDLGTNNPMTNVFSTTNLSNPTNIARFFRFKKAN